MSCVNRQKSAIFCLNGKNKTVFEDEGITFSICTKLYFLATGLTDYLRYWGSLQVQKQKFYHHFTRKRTSLDQLHGGSIQASGGQNESGKKSKKKTTILSNFCFLFHFEICNMTRDTITLFSHTKKSNNHQLFFCDISASSGQNELGEKI